MNTVNLTVPSTIYHNSQIITGFLALRDQGWNIHLDCKFRDPSNPFYDLPVVLAEYKGKQLLYDLWDGYQNPDGMRKGLEIADLYFKRSFSAEKNAALFPEYIEKIHPLGLNYHLTCKDNPINEPLWKSLIKPLTGRTPERHFTADVFEKPAQACAGDPKILFLAQLWDYDNPELPKEVVEERKYINATRIAIMTALRQRFGDAFIGGLVSTPLSQKKAPELVLSRKETERRAYLTRMHSADICIGTMGLYESIGWKTAEYVAASKAIVNERLHYQPTGNFAEGVNYLPFSTARECIDAVQQLVDDPAALLAMKQANQRYYQEYLKPDVLVKNTLAIVDQSLSI